MCQVTLEYKNKPFHQSNLIPMLDPSQGSVFVVTNLVTDLMSAQTEVKYTLWNYKKVKRRQIIEKRQLDQLFLMVMRGILSCAFWKDCFWLNIA